jgi:HSP20 family molecular chaperone IbpA
VDVYETVDSVVFNSTIRDVQVNDIDVSISSDTLTIKAVTDGEDEVERDIYLRRERRFGVYRRSVSLAGGMMTVNRGDWTRARRRRPPK